MASGEVGDSVVALHLVDSHEREVSGVAPP
jgi:hypothetical protein